MVEKFLLVGLKADLPAVRDANKLYWCSDTRELYKGNDLYTEAVRIVDALPDAMAQGVLYVLPTGEAKVFNGTDTVTVAKPYVTSENGEVLTADHTNDQVATAKMVYESIAQAVGAVAEGGELVNNIFSTKAGTVTVVKGAYVQVPADATFSEGTNYFTKVDDQYILANVDANNFATMVDNVLYVSSDEVDVALKGVVVNPTYEPTTRTITLPYADGTESLVINLGKDIFIDPTAENKYNTETGKIEIFLNDGGSSTIQYKEVNIGIMHSVSSTEIYESPEIEGGNATNITTLSTSSPDKDSIVTALNGYYPDGTKYYVQKDGEYVEFNDDHVTELSGTDWTNPYIIYAGVQSKSASTKIEIPASELVDIYTGATHTDGSTTVTVSEDNVITASVNISAKENNVLSKEADGLYVDAPTKAQHAEAVADIDALDVQLNGEEVVLKENGATTGATYTFNDNDTFMVDGIKVEIDNSVDLETILADANLNVTVITSNIEDRLADAEASAAANKESIESLETLVGTLPEGIEAENIIDYISEIAGETEIHIDASADNKYNKETGKIELYLNDGVETEENKTFSLIVNQGVIGPELHVIDDLTGNEIYSVSTSSISTSIMANSIMNDINAYYPNGYDFYLQDGTQLTGTYLLNEYNRNNNVGDTKVVTFKERSTSPATKVEIDITDLEAKITANANAIAAVKATVDDGLYVQVEADATYVAGTTYYKADAEAGYVVDESVVDEATFDAAKANGLFVLADDAIAALSAKIAQNAADIANNDDAIDAVSYVQCTTNTVFDANTTYFMVDADGNFVEDTAIVDADTFAAAVTAGTAFVKTTDAVKANESRIATIENALTWGTFA